jgi:hypothetical protein
MKRYPNTKLGWHEYYVRRLKTTEAPAALCLAALCLLLHLAFGNDRIPA